MSLDSELVDRVLHLPSADRASLAHAILRSLEGADAKFDFDETWENEITNRIDQVDRGEVQLVDSDAVIDEARRALRSNETR
ncbi:MAG: addiction module protein [Phycisphaerae bacterium]|nr:addiction module protein [Phycisphaerae bacterium]